MAFDERLLDRVRAAMQAADPGPIVEKRMFGGVAFMLAGNMSVAVRGKGGGLMVRVDPEQSDRFVAEPGAALTEMGGRAMRGWITVDAEAVTTTADLRRWVKRGVSYAQTLPAKA